MYKCVVAGKERRCVCARVFLQTTKRTENKYVNDLRENPCVTLYVSFPLPFSLHFAASLRLPRIPLPFFLGKTKIRKSPEIFLQYSHVPISLLSQQHTHTPTALVFSRIRHKCMYLICLFRQKYHAEWNLKINVDKRKCLKIKIKSRKYFHTCEKNV